MAKGAIILGAGFNAHGQLDPTAKPNNIHTFKQISSSNKLGHKKGNAVPAALWSSTLMLKDDKLIHFGDSGGYPQDQLELDIDPAPVFFFGDVSGVRGFCSQNGKLGIFDENPPSPQNVSVKQVTIAGNGKVCVAVHAFDNQSDLDHFNRLSPTAKPAEDDVYTYSELKCFFKGRPPESVHAFKEGQTYPGVTNLVATSTTFTALTGGHQVVTWGDPRYPALLGRTPTNADQATIPDPVSALDGIPIRKIVAASWMVAALSAENDLYIWGHTLPRAPAKRDHAGLSKLLNAVNENGQREDVHLVDVPGEPDIEDVAVGDEHIVVLTKQGEIWGFGSNEYGQLGLGEEAKGTRGEWVKCHIPKQGERVVELKAGALTTFLVVMNKDGD
ncbi:MAG: hypothetical protein LQ338_004414 [Usnochroma carphineum]|nr:MAG: hypothetical protein LQ338_004414 [Usnochroma carphineum]